MDQVQPSEGTGLEVPMEATSPKEKGNKVLITILLISLITTLVGLIYFVLKENGIDLLEKFSKASVEEIEEENIVLEETEKVEEVEEKKEESKSVDLVNKGWALYTLPEYGFSVEVPSYIMNHVMFEKEVSSDWRIGHHNKIPESFKFSWRREFENNFEHYIFIRFFPMSSLGSEFGGGLGSSKEHNIDIYIYKKNGEDNLFKNRWIEYAKGSCPVGDETCLLDIKEEKKWNKDVISYIMTFPTGMESGYLLFSDSYSFDLKFYINPSNPESREIALKVLDSMKFE